MTTSPCTIAWHPRRERSVRPWAVSRRSSSSSSTGDKLPSPCFTTTWHVVQAQLPPQLCSRRIAWSYPARSGPVTRFRAVFADPWVSRRERGPAATARLGIGVLEGEASREPLVHVVERRAVEVEVALHVDDHLHPVDVELLVLFAELGVELEVVRMPRAPATLHAHAQERVLEMLLALEPLHSLERARCQGNRHVAYASSLCSRSYFRAPPNPGVSLVKDPTFRALL